ncbi:MAG: bifunctional diguanylate cyclase/phosphodiesterase [Chloroflexia bacterium]
MFLDLDRFKVVNDTLGHEAGDHLLMEVSSRIRACTRDDDTVARLGGDEFTVLLEDVADISDAVTVAERIGEALKTVFRIGDHDAYVSASIGIAFNHDAQRAEVGDLLRDADIAMYRAKKQRGAGYHIFDERFDAYASEQLSLENDLRRAMERSEFVMYYQPKVNLATGRIVAVEALIRWEHPTRGLLLPTDFIPLAEEAGLIPAIGHWALEQACEQAQMWNSPTDEDEPLEMCVNLFVDQFQRSSIVDQVESVLAAVELCPRSLTLEVPARALLHDLDSSVQILTKLKALGVMLAIDLGADYSNIGELRRLSVDVLNIERGYVKHLRDDETDSIVLKSLIDIAHSLNLTVVASGVETGDQAAMLLASGCDMAQGYYFSRAVPAAALKQLLNKQPGRVA